MGVGIETFSKAWRLRQGANSASTAKVTRIFIENKHLASRRATRCAPTKPSVSGNQALRGAGTLHFSGAAFFDIAVGFVTAYGSLESRRHRARLEAQFALRAGAIHKHHVPRNLHAFDRNAWFAATQPGKHGIGIGYTQGQ